MTKEDYMKLSKERLAELLVERDSKPVIPISIETYCPPCYGSGPCTNPFHDCINCPHQSSDLTWATNTLTNSK
jgi:hypothetical protein